MALLPGIVFVKGKGLTKCQTPHLGCHDMFEIHMAL